MKVNFNQSFKDYKGEETNQVIKDTVCQCLYSCADGYSAEEKFRAYKLNLLIIPSTGEVELSPEDAALIKRICERSLTAGGYGQIAELIG
ncbi:hypothetical protein ACGE0T_14240 [Parabacteroides sp. APC149_11_2_Y6]